MLDQTPADVRRCKVIITGLTPTSLVRISISDIYMGLSSRLPFSVPSWLLSSLLRYPLTTRTLFHRAFLCVRECHNGVGSPLDQVLAL